MTDIKLNNSTLATASGSTISWGSGVPAGTVIQTVTDQHEGSGAITITTTSNDYLGSDLQCTITPKANGNKLFIQAFIQGCWNAGANSRGLHMGFAYDVNFNSGNGTTIGPRAVIADYHNYITSTTSVLSNLTYSITVTVGTQAPSAGSASIIRPILQGAGGDVAIAANSNTGVGLFSMMVMEIQA